MRKSALILAITFTATAAFGGSQSIPSSTDSNLCVAVSNRYQWTFNVNNASNADVDEFNFRNTYGTAITLESFTCNLTDTVATTYNVVVDGGEICTANRDCTQNDDAFGDISMTARNTAVSGSACSNCTILNGEMFVIETVTSTTAADAVSCTITYTVAEP